MRQATRFLIDRGYGEDVEVLEGSASDEAMQKFTESRKGSETPADVRLYRVRKLRNRPTLEEFDVRLGEWFSVDRVMGNAAIKVWREVT